MSGFPILVFKVSTGFETSTLSTASSTSTSTVTSSLDVFDENETENGTDDDNDTEALDDRRLQTLADLEQDYVANPYSQASESPSSHPWDTPVWPELVVGSPVQWPFETQSSETYSSRLPYIELFQDGSIADNSIDAISQEGGPSIGPVGPRPSLGPDSSGPSLGPSSSGPSIPS
eukprot:3210942-Amphidinium_carterae.1